MYKLRAFDTLMFIGAPDRVMVGLFLQQAVALGLSGFAIGLALIEEAKGSFPRRVQIEAGDLLIILAIVVLVCLAGSVLGVRAALKINPAEALASG